MEFIKKLTQKKSILDAARPMPPALVKNLDDWFCVELTFTSNAIEGNTLTRRETAVVIEKGLTIGGKSLREHLEATNHAKALELVKAIVSQENSALNTKIILDIHAMILHGTDDENAGRLRTVPVRISGSPVVMPNPVKVPQLMDEYEQWLDDTKDMHPVLLASEAHYRLVTIHPFTDGNGHTARLVMNLLLLQSGYPPAIIRKRDRIDYLAALEKAQLGGSKDQFEVLIMRSVERSLDIYLKAIEGEAADYLKMGGDNERADLLKIGQLASQTSLSVPTIRHWIKEGLIQVAEQTRSGYQLFAPDMVERVALIVALKAKRLTLNEIKLHLL
jgi:Fic family protein